MGISLPAGTIVRTGAERATLVRRTYSLVFVSVLVTIAGSMFALSQPRILGAVAEGVTGHASSAAVAVEGLRLLVVGGIGILFPPPAAE